MKNKPLLSICIPTYNRSRYLEKTIESIVSDPVFSSREIELVISDNASVDDTEKVVKKFSDRYDNIVYSRNSENIVDRNFPVGIALTTGVFCKLSNDTALFLPGSLSVLLNYVKSSLDEKPILFFSNGKCSGIDNEQRCFSADEFAKVASYWTTWIAAFGIWEEDFRNIQDRFAGTELRLWQTKVLYESLSLRKKSIIINKPIVEIQIVENKGGYNIFEIFAKNFLDIVKIHSDSGLISEKTFNYIKRDLFYNFLVSWYFNTKIKSNLHFELRDMRKILKVHYSELKYLLLIVFALLYPFKIYVQKTAKIVIILFCKNEREV